MPNTKTLATLVFAAIVGALSGSAITHRADAASVAVNVVCTSANYDPDTGIYTDRCITSSSDQTGENVVITVGQTGSLRYPVGAGGNLTLP